MVEPVNVHRNPLFYKACGHYFFSLAEGQGSKVGGL